MNITRPIFQRTIKGPVPTILRKRLRFKDYFDQTSGVIYSAQVREAAVVRGFEFPFFVGGVFAGNTFKRAAYFASCVERDKAIKRVSSDGELVFYEASRLQSSVKKAADLLEDFWESPPQQHKEEQQERRIGNMTPRSFQEHELSPKATGTLPPPSQRAGDKKEDDLIFERLQKINIAEKTLSQVPLESLGQSVSVASPLADLDWSINFNDQGSSSSSTQEPPAKPTLPSSSLQEAIASSLRQLEFSASSPSSWAPV